MSDSSMVLPPVTFSLTEGFSEFVNLYLKSVHLNDCMGEMIMRHYIVIRNGLKSLHIKVYNIVILRCLSPSPHINNIVIKTNGICPIP